MSRLDSGCPGTMAGPEFPPWSKWSRESSWSPPSLEPVWQEKQFLLSTGRTRDSKNSPGSCAGKAQASARKRSDDGQGRGMGSSRTLSQKEDFGCRISGAGRRVSDFRFGFRCVPALSTDVTSAQALETNAALGSLPYIFSTGLGVVAGGFGASRGGSG